MPKTALPPNYLRGLGAAAPVGRRPDEAIFSRPVIELQIGKIAAQLVAGYGHDAIPLARRKARLLFEQGNAINFADWCLVILALEELERLHPRPSASESKN